MNKLTILAFSTLLGVHLATATSAAQGDCLQPQGNAQLTLSGLMQLRSQIQLDLSGRPLAPFLIAADGTPGPIRSPLGTICLGPGLFVVYGGALSVSGQVALPITVPNVPHLVGAAAHFQGFVVDDTAPNGFAALSNAVSGTIDGPSAVQTIYFEDFEGSTLWTASNGVWQIGTPSNTGPGSAFAGARCAGTNLTGNYPDNAGTTLMSWRIPRLPAVATDEEIGLTYRVWFSAQDNVDKLTLMVSQDSGQSWQPVPGVPQMSGSNGVWARTYVDMSAYAGADIRLGFRLTSDWRYNYAGFYIDDVHVFKARPYFDNPEDFERGAGPFWGADNGLWEIGTPPASGPCQPHSGTQCAGVVLRGNYPDNANTRLIGATVLVPPAATLFFWHCFVMQTGVDQGYVEVFPEGGSGWQRVAGPFSGSSAGWTRSFADLSSFAGQRVRIAFNFTSDWRYNYSGWYLDDIMIR